MISARMDRRITIEADTGTRNEYGEVVQDWTELATVWAAVKQQSAREGFESAGQVSEVEAAFTIRYRSDVDSGCRVLFDGRYFDVTGVREVGRKGGLEIMAKAQT